MKCGAHYGGGGEAPRPLQPDWLIRVKKSASVTGFVLAEGTHQTDVFSANFDRYGPYLMTTGGGP